MGLKQVERKISVADPTDTNTDKSKRKKIESTYLAWEVETVKNAKGEEVPSEVTPDDMIVANDGIFEYSIIQRGRLSDADKAAGKERGKRGVVNNWLDGINANLYREKLAEILPEDPYAEIRKTAEKLSKLGLYTVSEAFEMLKAKQDAKDAKDSE